MPNRNTDTLFQLIKSLEKSEKRNFKLYANRNASGEELKSVQLFDALDKMDYYDEAILFKNKLDYGAGSAGYQLMAELFNESAKVRRCATLRSCASSTTAKSKGGCLLFAKLVNMPACVMSFCAAKALRTCSKIDHSTARCGSGNRVLRPSRVQSPRRCARRPRVPVRRPWTRPRSRTTRYPPQ